jgi:hypothetical protein
VDDHSDYEDWIELYNAGSSSLNIGGYYLSDDSTNNTKYQIPAGTQISAGGYFRFWCSGRNTFSGNNYHTNFRITQTKNNGEDIVFSDPSGVIIDATDALKTQNVEEQPTVAAHGVFLLFQHLMQLIIYLLPIRVMPTNLISSTMQDFIQVH